MNLLGETKDKLKENGKTIHDISWVGCREYSIPLENFIECADKEYDDGYGSQEVAIDLMVVGDTWWLERHEYDGAEWWEYKELPQRPIAEKTVNTLIGGFWHTLEKLNERESRNDKERL